MELVAEPSHRAANLLHRVALGDSSSVLKVILTHEEVVPALAAFLCRA
jgi:hypothetical protein